VDINTQFNRSILSEVMEAVREHTTVDERKAAQGFIYPGTSAKAKFHGPEGFHWRGSAASITEAKTHGWRAWLKMKARKRNEA